MHCIIFLGCSLKNEGSRNLSLSEVGTFFCKKAAAAAESPKKVSQILQASIRCVQFEVGCIQQVHHQYFMFTAVHMH